jgi:hypothetical protein
MDGIISTSCGLKMHYGSNEMDTLHLDAFQTSLHGIKILCQGPFVKGKLPPLSDAIHALRAPFKRKVLLTNTPFSFNKLLAFQYDASFQIREGVDWSLALTYILHAPKDVLVVAEDIAVPDAVWPKLTKNITFVHIVTAPLRAVQPYDVIFFAPIDDIHSNYVDIMLKGLMVVYNKTFTQKDLKDILQELRVAKAGLAWSKVQEERPQGCLYWYDPDATVGEEPLSKKQIAELFQWLSVQFT